MENSFDNQTGEFIGDGEHGGVKSAIKHWRIKNSLENQTFENSLECATPMLDSPMNSICLILQ
ncbi:uncharacterized protein METZ01_LOCUS472111 [marine metagenome]|uniref:Uncharacterized protein n=1 Tax=marine metagenome TaxID=408172 RepID=A0A383BGL3_9ZZZZ